MKFTRRKDLETSVRINIAILALYCQGVYFARTELARQYKVSRSFLYQLIGAALFSLQELFSNEKDFIPPAGLNLDAAIVLMRFSV